MADQQSQARTEQITTSPQTANDASPQPGLATIVQNLRRKPRVWPGVILAAILVLGRLSMSIGDFSVTKMFFALFIIPIAVVAGLLVWWMFASRVSWFDRFLVVGTLALVTIGTVLASGSAFPSFALFLYSLPFVVVLWPAWLLATPMLSWPVRRAGVLAIFLFAGIISSMLRVDGMDGEFNPTFSWRFMPTAEQKLLAELNSTVGQPGVANSKLSDVVLKEEPGDWAGFRGPKRDSRVVGVKINTDWEKSPPKELWRHRIGPGWSSFAVVGGLVFTQEQRGDDEYVVCYDAANGGEVWAHHDTTRFTELVAGPGPRATPTFYEGRIYALGANGDLNCLKASDGSVVWSKNIAIETDAKVPNWGFSSSPLVAHGLVSVFAGAPPDDNGVQRGVVAFNADTGEKKWTGGKGGKDFESYCSPHLAKFNDSEQILINTSGGTEALEPDKGTTLWSHEWPGEIVRVIQPTLVGDHELLIGTGLGVGTRKISVTNDGKQWTAQAGWTSRAIKPYYNDMVVVENHLYGFDGSFLVCVDLKDGTGKWRARGYGNGQLLLLADQKLLLILSEQGDVALVRAQPDKHEELAKFKAMDGKTWNHPVVAHGKLFVRNGETIVCYALPLAD
jgi:outer membrane protein assembly factor BamB